MLGFKQYLRYLEEKLILYNRGAKYGQVVFLAGGAASGKGKSTKAFMDGNSFKIRDVDEWKRLYMRLADEKDQHPEIKGLDLRNPRHVFQLHNFVKSKGVKSKSLDLLLGNATKPDMLPNIIFDVTLKDRGDITEVMPALLAVGYDPKNIHITWILTNYKVAVQQNRSRSRVVPEDILLQTHEGAATTMHGILAGDVPKGVDGEIRVVLNNRENEVYWLKPDGTRYTQVDPESGKEFPIIRSFKYVTVKQSGRSIDTKALEVELLDWIRSNAPKSGATKHLFAK